MLDNHMTARYERQHYIWRKKCRNGMLCYSLKLEGDSFAADGNLFSLSSKAALGPVELFTDDISHD